MDRDRIVSVHVADSASDKLAASNGYTHVRTPAEINQLLADPLHELKGPGVSMQDVFNDGHEIARKELGLSEEECALFGKGALLAVHEDRAMNMHSDSFSSEEKNALIHEEEHPWKAIPKTLFMVVILSSLCAAVQGMDETVVNGAQIFYAKQFGIQDEPWILGLVNSAPYLACAVAGCWLSIPLNKWMGRKGTIIATCICDICCCIGQSCVNSWQTMLAARLVLGLGIGCKSATVPVYTAECAPAKLRGALTMQWQMWTAFGIMVGFASDLAFFNIKDVAGIVGLNWRLMMGSASLFAWFVVAGAWACPESPRYLIDKAGRAGISDPLSLKQQAWESMRRLRKTDLSAARDTYVMLKSAEAQALAASSRKGVFHELFMVGRNRRAMIASEITMFMQQFCGINVIAYYSSVIFLDAGFTDSAALAASLGFGAINFLFAIPAVWTIDSFGRRNLLLMSFPAMAICLIFTGLSFLIPNQTAQVGCVALGIYLFGMVYSPGEGPVPFVYSAEAYPLYIRTYGMALATATTWFFNFVLAITWPGLLKAFTPTGAFCYYGAWCIIGAILILFFVPETKGKSLEQLDAVFSVKSSDMFKYGMAQLWYGCRYITTFGRGAGQAPELPVVLQETAYSEKARDEESRTQSMAHTLVNDRGMSKTSKFVDDISPVSPKPI